MAIAIPNSEVVGPYRISFDLGLPSDSYYGNVSIKETESISGDKETEYLIKINDASTRIFGKYEMWIYLTKFDKELESISAIELKDRMEASLSSKPDFLNYVGATREIDGTIGAIASFDYNAILYSMPGYTVIYRPTFDASHLSCVVTSTFPWDGGTLQLFKTIHVEKVN